MSASSSRVKVSFDPSVLLPFTPVAVAFHNTSSRCTGHSKKRGPRGMDAVGRAGVRDRYS
jgi:hypothetical protein